jgi:hypothetical protein
VNFKNLSDAVRAKREMEGKPLATSIKLSIQFTKVTYTAPTTSAQVNAPSASALTKVYVDTRRGKRTQVLSERFVSQQHFSNPMLLLQF